MTPFDRDLLLPRLRELQRWRGGPVPCRLVADVLGMSERTLRWRLRRLETLGAVGRPWGPRRGWCTVTAVTVWMAA